MRIVHINMLHNGSTGKIMLNIAECARKQGNEVWTFSPIVHYLHSRMEMPDIDGHQYFGSRNENMIHRALDRVFCVNSCFSFFGTQQLIRALDDIHPDIIHLHNLHNLTMNLKGLFQYIKRKQIKVVWTLHDCWAMTGRCPNFGMAKCDRWQDGCGHCPQVGQYPRAYIDMTHLMWAQKKKWFTGVKNMVIVTPSQWLADIVGQSYLQNYPIKVINSGIDLSVFKPTASDFRRRYGCDNRKIVLGVAFDWSVRKGLDVFVELALRLPDDYQIVLVGGDKQTDRELPENVISIHRTQNQRELAAIYSAADVFVNPTREDNFPTVNIEALACGTPVITFRTGGSPEMLDPSCGMVVLRDDVDALRGAIVHVAEEQPFSQETCLRRAQKYAQTECFEEYVDLYSEMAARE